MRGVGSWKEATALPPATKSSLNPSRPQPSTERPRRHRRRRHWLLPLAPAVALGGCDRQPVQNASDDRGLSQPAVDGGAVAAPAKHSGSTLFVKYGQTLIPLACSERGKVGISDECEEQPELSVTLLPGGQTVQGRRERMTKEGNDQPVFAWLIEGTRPPAYASGPFGGFGLSGRTSDTDFRVPGTQQIRASLAVELREKTEAVLENSSLSPTVSIKINGFVEVKHAAGKQRVFSVRVQTGDDRSRRAGDLELPQSVWFLFCSSKEKEGVYPLTIQRDFDFGLGEGGEIVGVIDLDRDGIDELLTVWTYAEGRIVEVLGRVGATSFRRIAKIQQGT